VNTTLMDRVTQNIQKNTTFNTGGQFNFSVGEWIKSVKTTPMPTHLTLTSIDSLLTTANFPTLDKLTNKKDNVGMALKGYCLHVQKHYDTTISCLPALPIALPTPAPVAQNAARRICVRNESPFKLKFDINNAQEGSAPVTASSDKFNKNHVKCLEGSQIRAGRGDILWAFVHAFKDGGLFFPDEKHSRTMDQGCAYDKHSTLQAVFECRGTTSVVKDYLKCDYVGLMEIGAEHTQLIV